FPLPDPSQREIPTEHLALFGMDDPSADAPAIPERSLAELVRRSRSAQGLPPTVGDAGTLAAVAAILRRRPMTDAERLAGVPRMVSLEGRRCGDGGSRCERRDLRPSQWPAHLVQHR